MLAEETKVVTKSGARSHFEFDRLAEKQLDLLTDAKSKRSADARFKEDEAEHQSFERGLELRAATVVNSHPQLSQLSHRITFYYADGCLMLAGQVPSFYLKQVIQEVVRRLEGVQTVENRIEVSDSLLI